MGRNDALSVRTPSKNDDGSSTEKYYILKIILLDSRGVRRFVMESLLEFANREEFHKWLSLNSESSQGVWLLFGKKGGKKTLTANEALGEALCFGWIDGQMQKIDEFNYKKYFAKRTENSKWSERNKKIATTLEKQGLMTEYGIRKIEEAKKNGQWNAKNAVTISNDDISYVTSLLVKYEEAHKNFLGMSPSVKKTYTRAYLDAKTEAGKEKRLAWMVDRLNKNLKPM